MAGFDRLPGFKPPSGSFPVDVVQNPGPTFAEEQAKKFAKGNTAAKLEVIQKFQDRSLAESAFEVLQNAGTEAKDIILGLGALGGKLAVETFEAITNPVDTLEAITSGEALEDFQDILVELKDGIADDYTDRYGGLFTGDFDEFLEATKDKPLSFLLDAAGAASLVGGSLKNLGRGLTKEGAVGALEKTGTVLQNFGQAIEPMNLVGRGARKVSNLVPDAPVIGANAVRDRAIKKTGRKLFIEEQQKLIPDFEERLNAFASAARDLSADDFNKMILHHSGIEVIPENLLTPELKSFMDITENIYANPVNKELFGITDEVARRRELLPQVLDRFQNGSLNLSDDQARILQDFTGLDRAGNQVLDFKGVENLPEFLFNEKVTGPFNKSIYLPMIDKEAKLGAAQYIGRITNKLNRAKSPFEKTTSGLVMQKYLKTRDINQLADFTETTRRFLVDTTNEKLVRNVADRIAKSVDPKTGAKLAKPYYIGDTPSKLVHFQSADDAFDVLSKLDNPLTGIADEDALYKRYTGKSKQDFIFDFKKTIAPRRLRTLKGSDIDELAKRDLLQQIQAEGFDGFILGDGSFAFADPLKNPLTQLLDDHVLVNPSQLVQNVQQQKILAKEVFDGTQAGKTLEEASESALKKLFPDGDVFEEVKGSIGRSSGDDLAVFNDRFLDKTELSKFFDDLNARLGKSVLDKRTIEKTTNALKMRASKGAGAANKAQWAAQIPKSMADEILGSARPEVFTNTNFKLFWDTPTKIWRSAVLNFSGRWHVNNFLGGLFLNTLSGVLNPLDYARAGRLLGYRLARRFPTVVGPQRSKILKFLGMTDDQWDKARALDNIMPPELALGTFASSENVPSRLLSTSKNPFERALANVKQNKVVYNIQKAANASGDFNSLMDRFFRDAQFFKHVRGQIRKQKIPTMDKVRKGFFTSYDDLFEAVDNLNAETAGKFVDSVNEWLPNYSLLLNRTERNVIRKVLPFYSWMKHMFTLAMTMPIKHPKRSVLIENLGKIGKDIRDEEFREAGIDPRDIKLAARWLEGTIPVNSKDGKVRVLSTRAANPLSSVLEIDNIGSSLHPALKLAIERLSGTNLFTGRPLPTEVVIGPDGIPQERLQQSLVGDLSRQVPQIELLRRLARPEVESVDGEVLFRRNRVMELFKHLGININEQEIDRIKERAAKKEGLDVGRAFNSLLKKKRFAGEDNSDVLQEVLRSVNSQ